MDKQKLRAIYDEFKIPPSFANIRVEGPVPTVSAVKSGFLKAGLTASDLTPIDWRKKSAISPVKNQQSCGDCWAMSSTSALADRFIAQKGLDGLVLEHALTAQCVTAGAQQSINAGCDGGQPFLAGQFFENYGCPSADGNCPSWEKLCGGAGCNLPTCNELKQACNSSVIYKAKKGSTKNLGASSGNGFDVNLTIANIKKELLNGPVVACFFVPIDFMASAFYKWDATNGIYINGAYGEDLDKLAPDKFKARFDNPVGEQWGHNIPHAGHAVEVVGWDVGETKNPKYGKVAYWIVKNSWGTDWMDGGYFKIAMSDSGLNKGQAFDVPVVDSGGAFGGCVSFDPDLSTGKEGDKKHSNPAPDNQGGGSKPRSKVKFLWIIFGLLILILLCLIAYHYYKNKNSSSYAPPSSYAPYN